MKIFINPGHAPNGMPDPGAVNSITGLRECDVSLTISNKVAEYLRVVGYEVRVLQSDSLKEVVDTSNAWESDLFLSIHCNAAANTNAKGTETFYSAGSVKGEKLAQCIQDQIINSLGTVDRGLKTNNLYVTKYTDCPAVLIETAFISNVDDEALLADENKRDQFAAATARGVTDYVSLSM